MVSVLVAPDKFKGSLSADEVARALEHGLGQGAPHARVRRLTQCGRTLADRWIGRRRTETGR
jgi:glycerate kinase